VKSKFVTALTSGVLLIAGCTTSSQQSEKIYDYYFPKKSKFAEGSARRWFDEILSYPNQELRRNDALFRAAMQGDIAAFRAFLVSPDRGMNGEFGETWYSECVALLLHLGDEKFAKILAQQDRKTKVFVANALKYTIQWRKHPFPKTEHIMGEGSVPRIDAI
jgi:hypothetical protein